LLPVCVIEQIWYTWTMNGRVERRGFVARASSVVALVASIAAIGCGPEGGSGEGDEGNGLGLSTPPPSAASGTGAGQGLAGTPATQGGASGAGALPPLAGTAAAQPIAGAAANAGTSAAPPTAGTGAAAGTAPAPPVAGAAAAAGTTPAPPVAGTGGPTAGTTPPPPGAGTAAPPPLGPDDGDPNAPIIDIPGIPCGPNPSLFGLTTTNATIGGRDVHIAYPCNKHVGAKVTFIFNLHGTNPVEELKLYQVAYFSANNLVDSHNFITAAPKSVVSQWGNGDGGQDLPHLYEVVDWVYSTFSDFDIRAMWIGGHSWGAMYTTTFVCDARFAGKVKGTVLMSGFGEAPACSAGLSIISSAAEVDIGPVVNQGLFPTTHGCGAAVTNMVGNNIETHWPNCSPGFVHANYLMLGKGHADYIDPEVVTRIGDLINEARP
jgi:hypothetical protein